jgi:hypothetical protein
MKTGIGFSLFIGKMKGQTFLIIIILLDLKLRITINEAN